MKATVILFILLFSHFSFATDMKELIKLVFENASYSDPALSEQQSLSIQAEFMSIYQKAYDEVQKKNKERSFSGFLPKDLYGEFEPMIQKLYKDGYLRIDHYDFWKSNYEALYQVNPPANFQPYSFWKEKYQEVFKKLFDNIKKSPAVCAKVGENSTAAKCCQGLISFKDSFNVKSKLNNKCELGGKSCNENQNCCSGVCQKNASDKPGVCLQKMVCYQIHEYEQTCGNPSPFCKKGDCTEYTKNITGLLECKQMEKDCKKSSECCSDLCSDNKCVQNLRCLSCKKSGNLEKGESCCEGYINIKGRCVPPIRPLVPSVKTKTILEKFLNTIFSAAYAADDIELSMAQKNALQVQRANCDKKEVDKDICLEKVDRLEVGYKKDKYTGLTTEQSKIILDKRSECSKNHKTTVSCSDCEGGSKMNPQLQQCMSKIDEEEKVILVENERNGIKGVSLNKEDYLNEYEIPGVTALTYSDMKTCQFNSYNDSWRDSTTKERNAEVFLRSFEYVFSHKGTQDFWEEGNKGNIFTRANKAAIRFRENRQKYIENMMKIDEEMSCKCLAINGIGNFTSVQQQYFGSNCEEYNAELRQTLGDDLNTVNSKLGNGSSKIDGSSLKPLNSKKDTDIAKIEEIDKSSIGISQERLLIDFLNLKAQAQVMRFTDNSDLELELTELSDYIKDKDFNEVFKDKIQGGLPRVQNNMAGNSRGLYGWGYRYQSSVAAVVGAIVTGGASLLLSGQREIVGAVLGLNSNGRSGAIHSIAAVESAMLAAWGLSEINNPPIAPEIFDHKVGERSDGLLYEVRGFKRYFVGPRYVNTEANLNKCEVMGRAAACVRSAYLVPFDESGYVNFILDPTLPLFVNENIISINGMPLNGGGSSNRSWVDYINGASKDGIDFLKTPEGGKPTARLAKFTGTWEFNNEIFRYNKTNTSFGERDVLGNAIREGHFLPDRGLFTPEEFGSRKQAIITAAKKYALCKNLKSCGARDLESGEIGFGFLFQSEAEASDFANYTYEIHYQWSHLTQNNYLGYPAAGLDQYFKLVAYNMKLAGSLAASRAVHAGEAVELYKEDFNNRLRDYSSLGQLGLSAASRNINFKRGFFKILGKLNFKGKSNIQEFNSILSKEISAGKFNQSERASLKAAGQNALFRNQAIQERDDFEAALVKSSGQINNLVSKNSDSLTKINNPLSQFSVARLGGGTNGFKKLNNSIADLNNGLKSYNNQENESKSKVSSSGSSTYSMPNGIDYSGGSNYNSPYTDGGAQAAGGHSSNDSGLNSNEVNSLLRNLKDEDLTSNDIDSLFKVVSKAYKRNYSKLLTRNSSKKNDTKENNDDQDSKEELEELLSK